MHSAPSLDSVMRLVEELRWCLEVLHKTVTQDAEAEMIDQAVSRCEETFALLREQGAFWASTRSEHHGEHTALLQNHLAKLLESYQTCLKALSAASTHTAQKFAHLQKTRSAWQEYEKIAHLG